MVGLSAHHNAHVHVAKLSSVDRQPPCLGWLWA
jgi:hypothetical protein